MSRYGPKIPKSQKPESTLYTIYYPHTIAHTERKWNQNYTQFISIDPGKIKNFAFRIERRYNDGRIIPIVFDKIDFSSHVTEGTTTYNNSYEVLTELFNKYKQFYDDCHYMVIEKQLAINYQAVRVSQHTISWFSIYFHNKPLLPAIVEVDPKLKGKYLNAPTGINEKGLKTWAVQKGRELLTLRGDTFSLGVLDYFKNKQDDLCDTICQIEALMVYWGLPLTIDIKNVNVKEDILLCDNPKDIIKVRTNNTNSPVIKLKINNTNNNINNNDKKIKFKIIKDNT